MATYFWVGGSGTWSGTGNTQFAMTSGGVPTALNPTNADTVTFDTNSGTAATVTCTSTAVSLDTTINKADITLLLSGSPTLCAAAGFCTLTAGTLNLNNFVLTTGRFNSNNANVRTITTGTGSFTVTGNNATIWNTGSATNLTYTSGFPTVNATYSGSVGTRVFSIAGTTDRINLNITAGTDIIAPNATFSVNNYNFTGFSGTLTNVSTQIYGSLTLSSTMTVSAGANTFDFRGVSGTNTITSAGKTMDFPITFSTAGVTWQLQDALTSGATRTCTLTAGTLDLGNQTLSAGLFSSSNTNTRVLAFGTGNITLTGVNTTIFNTTTVTGMTITGTPVVNCTATTGTSVQTRTFIAGAHGEAQAISVNINPGTSAVDIFRLATNTGAFKNVTFSSTFTGTIQISNTIIIYGNFDSGGVTVYTGPSTVTFAATSGTKTIKTSGLVIDSPITFSGVGGTWQLQDALTSGATRTTTLTNGTLDLNNFTLTTGFFDSNNANTRSLANNSSSIVITGNSATVVNFGTITNFTADFGPIFNLNYSGSTGTRTIAAATPTNILLALSIQVTAGSDIVTTSGTTTLNDFYFGGFTGTLGNATRNIYGAFSLSSGMATPSSGNLVTTFKGNGSNITTEGKTLDFPVTIDAIGGTWSFVDALTLGSTRALTIADGTLKLKAGATSVVGSLVTTGTTQKFLSSSTFGTQATISAASGTNNVTYLTIQDSNATGGASWYALSASIDAGNNTGWIFSPSDVGFGTGNGGTCFGFGFRI